MIYYSSDWHLGEKRLGDIRSGEFNPFFRPFKNAAEQDEYIINQINEFVEEEDVLMHLGDVCVNDDSFEMLNKLNCKTKYLILGNYDIGKEEQLSKYFNIMGEDGVTPLKGETIYMTHKPIDAKPDMFNLVGHIHGLWKVKPTMINVSVDAWHFRPVSTTEVAFVKNAIDQGFYDENVF